MRKEAIFLGALAFATFSGVVRAADKPTTTPPVPLSIPNDVLQTLPPVPTEQGHPLYGTCRVDVHVDKNGKSENAKMAGCNERRLEGYMKARALATPFAPAMKGTKSVSADTQLVLTIHIPVAGMAQSALPEKIAGSVMPPVPVYEPEAEIPNDMRRQRPTRCDAMVDIIIDRDGLVQNEQINTKQSTCGPSANSNALTTVDRYLFKPATKDGAPVAVRVTIDVNFSVD